MVNILQILIKKGSEFSKFTGCELIVIAAATFEGVKYFKALQFHLQKVME